MTIAWDEGFGRYGDWIVEGLEKAEAQKSAVGMWY